MAHLFIIAGHGAGDSGAVGYIGKKMYTEAERVRALAKRLSALGGSNVTVGDTSRNWYADKGISTLSIPKSWQIIELHMDGASASARGGHVIIKSGYKPDAYDTALAHFIGGFTPGRANTIVGRSNLANVNRAAVRGALPIFIDCLNVDLLQTRQILINLITTWIHLQEEFLAHSKSEQQHKPAG